jgi:hypothetical protein
MAWWNPVIGRRGPGDTDQVLFDAWSFIHFASGLLLWKLGLDANVAIMTLIVFELIENYGGGVAIFNWLGRNFGWIKLFDEQADYKGDSTGNMVMDILIGVAAYALAWFEIIPLGATLF